MNIIINAFNTLQKTYNWEGLNFQCGEDDWKKFEKNNFRIVFNVLYTKNIKLHPVYVSKCKSQSEKQIIFLKILDNGKWSYFAVTKKLSALLRGITWKYKDDFYCLNCFHLFRTINKLESQKKHVKIKVLGELECLMKKKNELLEFTWY